MIIYQDTREQNPFDLTFQTVQKKKLNCGDYTTSLLLDVCAIERKATTAEVYLNLGRKKNKERFFRELEKLRLLPNPIVLCCFPESFVYEFPENSSIPKHRYATSYEVASGKFAKGQRIDAWGELKISGKRLRSLLYEVNDLVPVVFCDNKLAGEKFALQMFEELENELRRNS